MNIAVTPTAETLIQQLIELGHDTLAAIVEQALQYFYSQQSIDTSLGFPEMSEADIIQSNDRRWENFQQIPSGVSQSEVDAQFIG